jgi:hypothetical protein
MVIKEEWDELDKKLADWCRWRGRKLDLPKVTCGDCRQPIEAWELRTQLGDTFYHADRCGPDSSTFKRTVNTEVK